MPTEPAQKNDPSMSTRRVDPWAAYAARYACSGRKHSVKRKNRSPCLIVVQAGDLKMPRAPRPHDPGKQPTDATRRSIPRTVSTWYVVVFAMYI